MTAIGQPCWRFEADAKTEALLRDLRLTRALVGILDGPDAQTLLAYLAEHPYPTEPVR